MNNSKIKRNGIEQTSHMDHFYDAFFWVWKLARIRNDLVFHTTTTISVFFGELSLKPTKNYIHLHICPNSALSLFLDHHLSFLALQVVFAASCDWWRGVVTPVHPVWVEVQLLEGRNAGGVASLHMGEVPGWVSVSVWVRPCVGRGRWGVSAFWGGQAAHRTALTVGVSTCM